MNILVIGSGGREHSLVWKIAQSEIVSKIYCAPGNIGMETLAECVDIDPDDNDQLVKFAEQHQVDLTIVGPEGPMANGIVDTFESLGLRIFGPSCLAAELETSKSFAKDLMLKYSIPTAKGLSFKSYSKAKASLAQMEYPLVIKADGLAAGKGVFVCPSHQEALNALKKIMLDRIFGSAGDKVVIEEALQGEEVSFLAFTDGKIMLPLPTSQDHKAVFDGDQGPNTGGMGAYSPAIIINPYMHKRIMQEIMLPTIRAMAAEGRPYKGVLYAGLMIDRDQIKVLEFNVRFGDPETQPLMLRIKNDIVPIMQAVAKGNLEGYSLDIDERAAVCVVMASGGYPASYQKGLPITGLTKLDEDFVVFHAGTARQGQSITTASGRVIGVSALGTSVETAIVAAYQGVSQISWENVHFRKDIGHKALQRLSCKPKVGIVMGSDSDLPVMEAGIAILIKFGIPYEITVASAHRSPVLAMKFASDAKGKGMQVIIAAAGHAAHLAGAMAAHTNLPVIGVPIDSSALQGLDALLSTVQMPPGIPVATVAIGKPGAGNAAILAAQIIALSDPKLTDRLAIFRKDMTAKVEQKARILKSYC